MSGAILRVSGNDRPAVRLPGRQPRLVLHAGTHKTGTTSIQSVLAASRSFLRTKGFLYPDWSRQYGGLATSHQEFAHALTGTNPTGWIEATALITAARNELKPGEAVVVSAEPVYRHQHGQPSGDFAIVPDTFWPRHRKYLETLRSTLAGFDVEVLVYFRARDRFAESLYWYMLGERGPQGSFADFVEAFAAWFDYERHVATFREVFPKVTVARYDEACVSPGGLIGHFFRAIGCEPPPVGEEPWERKGQYHDDAFGTAEARAAFLARYPKGLPQ